MRPARREGVLYVSTLTQAQVMQESKRSISLEVVVTLIACHSCQRPCDSSSSSLSVLPSTTPSLSTQLAN